MQHHILPSVHMTCYLLLGFPMDHIMDTCVSVYGNTFDMSH
jgi:hypothetical protein